MKNNKAKKILPFMFAALSIFSACKKENNEMSDNARSRVELDLNNLADFYKEARVEVANAHNSIVYATLSDNQQELDAMTMKFTKEEWAEKADSLYNFFVWAQKKQNTELHADKYYVLNAADTVNEIDVYKLNRLGLHVRVKGN